VRSQHIAEEIDAQFSMDDPVSTVSIADAKVQYALKGFERDLEKWSNQVPPEIQRPALKMTGHVVNLHMHEIAMHVDHGVEEFQPPFTEEALLGSENPEPDLLTPAHINALSTCLTSIDGIFETFLSFEVDVIRCLPLFHFVRVAYAVVVLMKMFFAAATPNSELGKVIDKDNMKVEYYLDGLLEIFKATAADGKSRPASKFLVVLIMLKSWFHRKREPKQPPENSETSNVARAPSIKVESDAPAEIPSDSNRQMPQQRQTQQPSYSPANTPLQLLSELATGNSGSQSRSETLSHYGGSSNEWQQPQQSYANTYPESSMNQITATSPQVYGMAGMGLNIDPALSMDLEYTMGDGFEQAMGMTLGDGDLGKYFSDDHFFASIMDTVGGTGNVFEGF
jgi:hypothetical protein